MQCIEFLHIDTVLTCRLNPQVTVIPRSLESLGYSTILPVLWNPKTIHVVQVVRHWSLS